jgi:hypothetical protein
MPLPIVVARQSLTALVALALCTCRPRPRATANGETGDTSRPADSLVIANGAVEVWFTLARTAQGSDGKECVERALEIRRGDTRVQVPLLYTGDAPVLLDDSTMRALLWNHCKPVDTYRVDLRSGRPVRESMRAKP